MNLPFIKGSVREVLHVNDLINGKNPCPCTLCRAAKHILDGKGTPKHWKLIIENTDDGTYNEILKHVMMRGL